MLWKNRILLSPEGPYEIGDVVTVDYTLNSFYQLNINWVIAFQINLGNGWTNLVLYQRRLIQISIIIMDQDIGFGT